MYAVAMGHSTSVLSTHQYLICNCITRYNLHIFFFLMIRHPPRSPLFPYPTLFRSHQPGGRRHPAGQETQPQAQPRLVEHGGRHAAKERVELSDPTVLPSRVAKILPRLEPRRDRKSTRLNSSHGYISYAVFCLQKKK